ncbi:MAG: exodeoxyribonuclease VII small subunit [Treponema sp.]|nr:exodeoxyribonuclease VII small subunit [Treponema sp.]
MDNFEQKLARLEELSRVIRQGDVSLEKALEVFEEGIKLSKGMEKELDDMEGKIQILMNSPAPEEPEAPKKTAAKKSAVSEKDAPVLDFFNDLGEPTGTRA